ncbi:MAG: hypothetical protein ACE5JU_19095 [Candidatus Binatia bacterium]
MTKNHRPLMLATALSVMLAACISPTQSVVCPGCCCPPSDGALVCVDFELPLTVGTQYGTPVGQSNGDVIFTMNNLPVSVHDFKWMTSGGTFGSAYIDFEPAFGSGQSIRTNNINLQFNFTQLGFQPSHVQFEFLDKGGNENISVNGIATLPLELTAVPTLPIGATVLTVNTVSVGGGDKRGLATLTGTVQTLSIGGQEFWIDRVCAR